MAHWIKPRKEGIISYGPGYVECSDCHKKIYIPDEYKFCPHCGQEIENIIISKKHKCNWIKVQEGLPAE